LKRFLLKFLEHWSGVSQAPMDWKRISKKCSTIQFNAPKKQQMEYFFKSLINLLIEELNPLSSNKFLECKIQMIFEIIEHPAFKISDKEEVMGAYIRYCFKLEYNIDNQDLRYCLNDCEIPSGSMQERKKGWTSNGRTTNLTRMPAAPRLSDTVRSLKQEKFGPNVRLLMTHIINGKYQSSLPELTASRLPLRFTEKIGNLKRILNGMAELYKTSNGKVLSADLIESIVEYKVAIKLLSLATPEWLTIDIKNEIERIVEAIRTNKSFEGE
jgi:hypothetical protein